MTPPRRVQLSRKKGWRMPENTVSVARPGKWGNPFVVAKVQGEGVWQVTLGPPVRSAWGLYASKAQASVAAVSAYRAAIESQRGYVPWSWLSELRGKNLACWCPLDQPCHADVLLELANEPPVRADKETR